MITRVEFVSLQPSGKAWEERAEIDPFVGREAPAQRYETTSVVKKPGPFELQFEEETAFRVHVVVHFLDVDKPWIARHELRCKGRGYDQLYNLDLPDHGGGEHASFSELGLDPVVVQRASEQQLNESKAPPSRWNGEERAQASEPVILQCDVLSRIGQCR